MFNNLPSLHSSQTSTVPTVGKKEELAYPSHESDSLFQMIWVPLDQDLAPRTSYLKYSPPEHLLWYRIHWIWTYFPQPKNRSCWHRCLDAPQQGFHAGPGADPDGDTVSHAITRDSTASLSVIRALDVRNFKSKYCWLIRLSVYLSVASIGNLTHYGIDFCSEADGPQLNLCLIWQCL